MESCIFATQGQIKSFDQTGIDLSRINGYGVPIDNTFGYGNYASLFSLFHDLPIAKIRDRSFLFFARPSSLARAWIGNLEMILFEQGHPIGIQSIADKQGQLSAQDIGGTVDEIMGTLLRARTHDHRQD